MPPRDDQELPEGTDQIINGAMETGAGAGASTGSSGSGFGGVGSGGTTPGGSADFAGSGTTGSSGFIGAGGGNDTGGLAGGGSGGSSSGFTGGSTGIGGGSDFGGSTGSGLTSTGGGSGGTGGATEQLKGGVQNLKSQATDKVRAYASDGKQKATTALDDLSQLVNETAQTIDDKMGAQYGDYARRAATAVSGFADTVRNKEVDELFDDAREIVRKSPGIAIGAAAVIGFSLVRLLKAGIPDQQSKDVSFQPDPALGGSTASTGQTTSDTQAPYVAPLSGV